MRRGLISDPVLQVPLHGDPDKPIYRRKIPTNRPGVVKVQVPAPAINQPTRPPNQPAGHQPAHPPTSRPPPPPQAIFGDGHVYEGEWQDAGEGIGQRSGQGVEIYTDLGVFVGHWWANMREGAGEEMVQESCMFVGS